MFLGRTAELDYLEQRYQKSGSQMVVVYGQKNAGRTTLLREFAKGRPFVFLSARSCSGKEQRYVWAGECAQNRIFTERYPAYSELLGQIAKSSTEKVILVIDEFQNVVKNDSSFMKELTVFLRNQGQVQELFVVLSSSSVGFVENNLVSRIGEAALSISGFLKVKELKFSHLRTYFSTYSVKECLEIYAVLGGFPGLWKYFENFGTVKDNIIAGFLKKDGVLLREALSYVENELRETSVYTTILASLASGRQKLNDLYLHTDFSRAKISVYLKNLMELELVEKIFSYDTEGKSNTQKGVYRIHNPLVNFYFHYIYPNLSSLGLLLPEEFYDRFIAPEFRFFVEPSMKKMCLEQLQQQNEAGKLPIRFTKSGEWVGKIGTIDIVAQDGTGHTLLALCNYEKNILTVDDYDWLMFLSKKAKLIPQAVYMYTVGGFDEGLQQKAEQEQGIRLISLKESAVL